MRKEKNTVHMNMKSAKCAFILLARKVTWARCYATLFAWPLSERQLGGSWTARLVLLSGAETTLETAPTAGGSVGIIF